MPSIRTLQRRVKTAREKVERFQRHFEGHPVIRRKRGAYARALFALDDADLALTLARINKPTNLERGHRLELTSLQEWQLRGT